MFKALSTLIAITVVVAGCARYIVSHNELSKADQEFAKANCEFRFN